MTQAGSERPERDDAEEPAEELGDLDVPDGDEVRGGSLNTYISPVKGEKQGGPEGLIADNYWLRNRGRGLTCRGNGSRPSSLRSRRRLECAATMVAAADQAPVGPPTSVGTGGAAATVERLATEAAIDALRRGGNAVDAAVTAAAVLGVTEPFSCGIGGGGFMLVQGAGRRTRSRSTIASGAAAMRPDSFRETAAPLAFNDARYSGISVGVPGTVRGWDEALKTHGTITLAQALAPAIAVARNGFLDRPDVLRPGPGQRRLFDDVPRRPRLPRRRRDAARRRHRPEEPRPRQDVRAARARAARTPSTAGPAHAIVQTVEQPPVARRQPRWRPGVMELADLQAYTAKQRAGRTCATAASTSSGWARLERRLDDRRGAQHARAVQPRRACRASGRCTSSSRRPRSPSPTAAPTSPTPTSSTCRSGLLPRSSRPGGALIGETAATSPWRPATRSRSTTSPGRARRRSRRSLAGSTTHLTVSDRRATSSYTFTIESTGGAGIVVPGPASC